MVQVLSSCQNNLKISKASNLKIYYVKNIVDVPVTIFKTPGLIYLCERKRKLHAIKNSIGRAVPISKFKPLDLRDLR